MMVLGLFGLVDTLARVVPDAVLRSLQLTVAFECYFAVQRAFAGALSAPISSAEGIVPAGLAGGAMLSLCLLRRRLEWGSIDSWQWAGTGRWHDPSLLKHRISSYGGPPCGFDPPASKDLAGEDCHNLPLTLLNSVLAVAALAGQLYPRHAGRVTQPAWRFPLASNVLVFRSAMPLSRLGWAGGQHKLERDSGVSVILLGLTKLSAGIRRNCSSVMRAFPQPILGLFLILAVGRLRKRVAWDTCAGIREPGDGGRVLWRRPVLPAFGAGWVVWWWLGRVPRAAQ
jgi:hypothetical protein